MLPEQLIEHFGTQAEAARRMQVTDSAVYLWLKQGFIPYDKQCQAQVETGGALTASRDDALPPGERAIRIAAVEKGGRDLVAKLVRFPAADGRTEFGVVLDELPAGRLAVRPDGMRAAVVYVDAKDVELVPKERAACG